MAFTSETVTQLQTAQEMIAALKAELIEGSGGDIGAQYIVATALIQAGVQIFVDTMPVEQAGQAAHYGVTQCVAAAARNKGDL